VLRTEDLNRYLRELAGAPVTAKDFRTLHGSALAGEALAKLDPAESPSARKRQMAGVVKQVSAFLQNTPAICRASYVAPCLFALFERGRLAGLWCDGGAGADGLRQREARLAHVLASTA
jgi:DNA topoisomerase-1